MLQKDIKEKSLVSIASRGCEVVNAELAVRKDMFCAGKNTPGGGVDSRSHPCFRNGGGDAGFTLVWRVARYGCARKFLNILPRALRVSLPPTTSLFPRPQFVAWLQTTTIRAHSSHCSVIPAAWPSSGICRMKPLRSHLLIKHTPAYLRFHRNRLNLFHKIYTQGLKAVPFRISGVGP